MILCRACKGISPRGSKYCQRCGGSFFVRYCGSGHASPPTAACCGTCGVTPLSDYVPAVRLGWITTLATLFVLVALWKLLLAIFPTILPGLLAAGKAALLYGAALLTNTNVSTVEGWIGQSVQGILCWFCCCLVPLFGLLINCFLFGWLLELIPGPVGKLGTALKRLPIAILLWLWRVPLRFLLRGTAALLVLLARGAGRLLLAAIGVRPRPRDAKKETK
jgi:hypothetical protein